jgi:hypothetical protein
MQKDLLPFGGKHYWQKKVLEYSTKGYVNHSLFMVIPDYIEDWDIITDELPASQPVE